MDWADGAAFGLKTIGISRESLKWIGKLGPEAGEIGTIKTSDSMAINRRQVADGGS
jgi:hypothetical protein